MKTRWWTGRWKVGMAAIVWSGVLVLVFPVLAEHYDITLSVESDKERQEAFSDDSPPPEGFNRRPVFHGTTGEPLVFQFFMTDVNPHEQLKQVKVRYYIARTERIGQKELPVLNEKAVLQGEFLLDFKPKGRVGLRQQFVVEKAGIYLVRVESVNSHSDHEHFSAIDMEINSK